MRRTALLTILLSMLLFTGCQESTDNVYFVMFESTPNIFDSLVYSNGVSVGEIVGAETAGNGVTRLAIVINDEHRELMKDSAAFYASSGRLIYTALAGYGNPVEPGVNLMGFSSRLGLGWFKAKNLLTRTPRAATRRAEQLSEAFEVSRIRS